MSDDNTTVNIEEDHENKENKKNAKKKFRYYENYISKLLKKLSDSSEITMNARQQLNHLTINLERIISNKALELTEISKKKTLSEKEVKNAIKFVLPSSLCAQCLDTAEEAINNYNDEKGITRQAKAGLIFPPSISEKFLRKFGCSKTLVTSQSPVLLASVLETVVSEILEEASANANRDNRVRVTVRDMELAVRNDSTLSELFSKNNLYFLGGGVVPYIHSNIKYDKTGERTNISCEIESYQNTGDCLMFAKHPFDRVVRSMISEMKPDTKVSSDVLTVIQYYVEQWLVDLLTKANNIAIYSGRLKLIPSDIEMVLSILENKTPLFFKRSPVQENS
jgi:histone H3/H4